VRAPNGASAGFYAGGSQPTEVHKFKLPKLEQETKYTIDVVADGSKPATDPKNATAHATATTGHRIAAFNFEKLHMRNDSDPRGSGEIHVAFGAGAVGESEPAGAGIWEGDLTDGYAVPLSLRVVVNRAPWKVWAQIYGWDDDHPGSFVRFWGGEDEIRYEPVGTWGREHTYYTEAKATLEFVPDLTPGNETVELDRRRFEGSRPFVVSTGDFELAFSVSGRMDVTLFYGTSTGESPGLVRPPRYVKRRLRTTLSDGVAIRHKDLVISAAKGGAGKAHVTAGPRRGDGPIRLGEIDIPDRLDEVAVAFDPAGQLHLYGLDAEGSLVIGSITIDDLGAGGDGEDGAGAVQARWRLVPGDGLRDLPVGGFSDETGAHLFALGRDGGLRHLRLPAGDGDAEAWDDLGPAPDGVLSAKPERDGTFVLTVVDNAESVMVRTWPDPQEWVRIGTIDALLDGRLELDTGDPELSSA
jgi:hypothetical protein